MTRIPALGTALLTLALATACTRNDNPDTTADTATPPAAPADPAVTEPAPAPAEAPAPAATSMQPGEVTGMLAAIDQHEIDAAEQARGKNVTGAVLDYANMLHKAHSENLAKTRTIGAANGAAPVESGPVQAQKEKGQAELATLGALTGKAYETAYVDAMVKGHTEALAKLDNELIPSASNEAVKAHLTEARGHVAAHLEQGKTLQASLK